MRLPLKNYDSIWSPIKEENLKWRRFSILACADKTKNTGELSNIFLGIILCVLCLLVLKPQLAGQKFWSL